MSPSRASWILSDVRRAENVCHEAAMAGVKMLHDKKGGRKSAGRAAK